MLVIHHRRNTIKMLTETNFKFGVEVDIRSFKNNLVVQHEPFINGILFEEFMVAQTKTSCKLELVLFP